VVWLHRESSDIRCGEEYPEMDSDEEDEMLDEE